MKKFNVCVGVFYDIEIEAENLHEAEKEAYHCDFLSDGRDFGRPQIHDIMHVEEITEES
jgi:hypothetical protein